MAPTYHFDHDGSHRGRLDRHFGFDPKREIYAAKAEQTLALMIEIAFDAIKGGPHGVLEFEVPCADRETGSWTFTVMPESIRVIGSGVSSAVRGEPWHAEYPVYAVTGWGYLFNGGSGEGVKAECLIATPFHMIDPSEPFEADAEITWQLRSDSPEHAAELADFLQQLTPYAG